MKKTPITKWFKPNFVSDEIESNTTDHSLGVPVRKKSKAATTTIIRNKNEGLTHKFTSNRHLLDIVSPKEVTDLVVHNKKISEVESWLIDNVLSEKLSVLVLNGPTGAGKTATVRVLCKSMNIKIIEWINPADVEIDEIRGPGQALRFTEFLMQSSRYPSLLNTTNSSKKIILVEDFPNFIMHNTNQFEHILEMFFNIGKSPAVFICTNTKDMNLNLAQHLFPDAVKQKWAITEISFNSVSVTNLKVALKRIGILLQEKHKDVYQTPSQETLDSILNTAMGDIRCAINYYNFACLKGSANLPISSVAQTPSGSKRKRTEKAKGTLMHMSRDESLGLLHGVGRVLYPKRVQDIQFWKLERQPETIVDQFITIPSLFVSFLHENYLRYFGHLEDVHQAAEMLSFSEHLMTDWKDKEVIMTYGLWIAVMGLMIANGHAVSKWNPVQGPKHLKQIGYKSRLRNRNIDAIDLGYSNIINNIDSSFGNKFS